MKLEAIVILAGLAVASGAPAAWAGPNYFAYNDTAVTSFSGVYLAPAGTVTWGPNQALNDDDKELDFGERLTLTGLTPGKYDVKLVDKKGRTCMLHGIDLTKARSFDIRDPALTGCE
ncbi:MAG: hypothetical protein ACREFP_11955 [Acetobacteraceae bacterium]